MPEIVVDLDGVVADFSGEWRNRLGCYAGMEKWDFLEHTPFKRWVDFWDWARDENIFGLCPPYPGAVWGIRWLETLGHITYVTHRPHWAEKATRNWLERHEIVHPVKYEVEKWRHKAKLYIDDAPHVVEAIGRNRPEAYIILLRRPWNAWLESADTDFSFLPASDWRDVVGAARVVLGVQGQQLKLEV
jgi:hypothetical protein